MKVKIQTMLGDIVVRLYDETPVHRDNFVKLVKEGYYDGTLFHRVIKDFRVLGVGFWVFGHSGDEDVWKPGVKEMLDDMHLRKIDLADEIFVVNVGGYIGESTRREIAYAEKNGKKVNYLEPVLY